jgi:uncharacterized OB-fold protein
VPDPLTQFFWDGVKEHKLMILRCQSCGKYIHWPRPVCRFCLSTELKPEQVTGKATLYSWTVNVYPDNRLVAMVELVEQKGLRMATNIIDCPEEELKGGMLLEVVFQEVEPGLTLPLFRPVRNKS